MTPIEIGVSRTKVKVTVTFKLLWGIHVSQTFVIFTRVFDWLRFLVMLELSYCHLLNNSTVDYSDLWKMLHIEIKAAGCVYIIL